MYRVIKSSTVDNNISFDDEFVIRVDLPEIVEYPVSADSSIDKFPGRQQFLDDVLKLLRDEYHFDVIDNKGYLSNRPDSNSIYFDTYYDLNNSVELLKRKGISPVEFPGQAIVNCFIHFRFSDHFLTDSGYKDHIDFLNENEKKHTEGKDILISVQEEIVSIPEDMLYRMYHDALDEVRYQLDDRISSWVSTAVRRLKKAGVM